MGRFITLMSRPFSPAELPGLSVWLDANQLGTLTLNGSTVAQWSDRSGKGNHATQATAIRQPKYVAAGINGLPAIEGRHDGSNASQMTIVNSPSFDGSQFTQFAVIKRITDLGTNEHLVGKFLVSGNQVEQRLVIQGSSDRLIQNADPDGVAGADTNAVVVTPLVGTTSAYIIEGSYSGTTLSARLNNTASGTGSLASLFNGTAPLCLFSQSPTFQEQYAGRIGEYLFFPRALSAGERQAIAVYLSAKWRITLA